MERLPYQLIPIGLSSQILKSMSLQADTRVLPSVYDLGVLSNAITACALSIGVIGPGLSPKDQAAARELLLDHAIGCVVAENLTPAELESAVLAALEERVRFANNPFLTQFINLLPDLVYFKDRHGRFLAGNLALARSFKIEDPALLIGRSDADFLVDSYSQKTLADEQAVMRTGLPIIAHSEKATYAENIIRWWSTSKAPLYDQTGRMIGTFGFSSEQTELKKAELSLSTERHLLEVLLTGLPDAVFIKDKSGHFLLANQVIAQWLGCTPASLRGRHDFDYYPAEFVETYRKEEEAILRTGMPLINKEEVLRTPDGRNLFLLTTKLPYKNQSGDIIGIIGICRNVTLRKEYDAQMKLVHAENESLRAEVEPLRKEVARLTAELSQARSG